jgi:transposase
MSQARRANRRQNFLLPPSIEDWVPAEDPVRFLAEFLDALDLPALGFTDPHPSAPGAPPFAAELLLAVWLYGYMNRVRSTRGLERACRTHLPLVWLTGMQYPDHNVLWRFHRDHRAAIKALFTQTVRVAMDAGLVGMVLHALDGTKLQAVASTSRALHKDALRDELASLIEPAVEQALRQTEQQAAIEQGEVALPPALRERAARRAQIAASLAALDAAGTDHLHPREPDARVMGTARGYKLAYNAQATVDENQFLVAQDVGTNASDTVALAPMLAQADANLGERPDCTAVDGGYVSADTLQAAHAAGHAVVVPASKVELATSDHPYDRSHFQYDAERDEFTCPEGKVLRRLRVVPCDGGTALHAEYGCKQRQCPQLGACTTSKTGRTVKRALNAQAIEAQRRRQAAPDVGALYALRKVLIEPVFGQIKRNQGFERFTVWGLARAQTQWALVCVAHNLKKLLAHWRAGALRLAAG